MFSLDLGKKKCDWKSSVFGFIPIDFAFVWLNSGNRVWIGFIFNQLISLYNVFLRFSWILFFGTVIFFSSCIEPYFIISLLVFFPSYNDTSWLLQMDLYTVIITIIHFQMRSSIKRKIFRFRCLLLFDTNEKYMQQNHLIQWMTGCDWRIHFTANERFLFIQCTTDSGVL